MQDSSRITLSKHALNNNIDFVKSLIPQSTKISVVVKSNAYGHGLKLFSRMVHERGIDHLSVFCFDEAKIIKNHLPDINIMIMGWVSNRNLKTAVSLGIEFYIFELERLEKAFYYADQTRKKAKIHLEVETGMNRTGLNEDDFFEAIRFVKKHTDKFILKGVCSHLAGPESQANYYRIQNQIANFERYKSIIQDFKLKPEYFHLANSAATITYPETHYDLVRIGIISYGLWPSNETFISFTTKKKIRKDPLKRVIRWDSKIMSIKEVNAGEFVGYGNYFITNKDMKIAVIPIGYSNSFNRSLTNRGRVLIRGKRCSIIGVVNMNMIIADISNIPYVKIGDEVVIIGKQKELEISVSSFSDFTDQLNYETLSYLPQSIPRKITE